MVRDYQINGETLVKVKGNGALGLKLGNFELGDDGAIIEPNFVAGLWELGLADNSIKITPRFAYQDIHIDDFGPTIPVEVMWMLADCRIEMTLVHYDLAVMEACISESMGGITFPAGGMAPAGQMMGRGLPLFSSGCHYISLNLLSPSLGFPWRFPTTYLDSSPLVIPLGTERSLVQLSWRAVPYRLPAFPGMAPPLTPGLAFRSGREIVSSGMSLWDHTADFI